MHRVSEEEPEMNTNVLQLQSVVSYSLCGLVESSIILVDDFHQMIAFQGTQAEIAFPIYE